VQNVNLFFNILYDGTIIGQLDATNLADDLADRIFKWKEPAYLGDPIAYAITSALAAFFTFGIAAIRVPAAAAQVVNGAVAIASGTAQFVSDYLEPLSDNTRDSGIRNLNALFQETSKLTREALHDLVDTIFSGEEDHNGNTIVDYLAGGSFLYDTRIPDLVDVEDYYKLNLIARVVNKLWREPEKHFFITSTTVDVDHLFSYPVDGSWTSPKTGRTFSVFEYRKKRAAAPPSLEVLNSSYYDIEAWEIAKSSAQAWQVARFNYSSEVARDEILASFNASSDLTPFKDQANWQGMFTIPVCDIGDRREMIADWGSKTLPCCCGKGCKDTAAFMRAANLNNTKSWYKQCQSQLEDSDLDIDTIDYGFVGSWYPKASETSDDPMPPPPTIIVPPPPPPASTS
jgi:hypothetical protein